MKVGIDPTSPHIHIGRVATLLKLCDFKNGGTRSCLSLGTLRVLSAIHQTKESERPMLSEREVAKNMRTYISQAGRIVDTKKRKQRKTPRGFQNFDMPILVATQTHFLSPILLHATI